MNEEAITDAARKKRFSIDLDLTHQASLAMIAKTFKITQGEVVAIMLDHMGDPTPELAAAFRQRRDEKVAARGPRKDLYQQFRNLTPAQMEAALAAAAAVQK